MVLLVFLLDGFRPCSQRRHGSLINFLLRARSVSSLRLLVLFVFALRLLLLLLLLGGLLSLSVLELFLQLFEVEFE